MKKIRLISALLLVVLTLTAFTACTPEVDDLKDKYMSEGYPVVDYSQDSISELTDVEEIEWAFSAVKTSSSSITYYEYVTCICFSKISDAKAFYKDTEESATDSFAVIRKGKTVIFGSVNAVEIAK